jgi:hypothetical protein
LQKFSTSELALTSVTSDTPERMSRQRPGSAVVNLELLSKAEMAHAIGTSPPNKKCVTFGIERV